MIPVEDTVTKIKSSTYNVLLDGKVLGFVPYKDAPRVVDKLRMLKIKKEETRLLSVTDILKRKINKIAISLNPKPLKRCPIKNLQ